MSGDSLERPARPSRSAIPIVLSTVAAVLAALLSPAVSPASAAGSSSDRVPSVPDLTVEPAEFVDEARSLPAGLVDALARDVGMSGAEYLAQGELASRAVELVGELVQAGVSVEGTRLESGELSVIVTTPKDAAQAAALGLAVEVGQRPTIDLSDADLEPAADLYGGAPYYYADDAGGGYRCSAGFAGTDLPSRARQVITAGHCLGSPASPRRMLTMKYPNDPYALSGATIGLPVAGSYRAGEGWDFGLIRVENPDVAARAGVLTWGGGKLAPLASSPLVVRDAYRLSTAGVAICKSGSTTGWTCGTVIGFVDDQVVGDPTQPGSYTIDAIVACITVRQGDSGGAAVIGSSAIGVTAATGSVNDARCGTTPSSLGLFTPLYNSFPDTQGANTLYGSAWEPLVAIDRPTSPAVTAKAAVFTGETLTGSVVGGGPRHRIEVVIDGGAKRTAALAGNGTWSVNISDLPRGTHRFTILSRWGQASSSSALTGRWLDASATRVSGDDRYETAANIALTAFPSGARTVFVANGEVFPDALSAGPAAAELDAPVLLTANTTLPASAKAALQTLKPTRIVVVGGAGAVSAGVAKDLAAYAPVERWFGPDRYATSREIARRAFGASSAAVAYVATGAGFADALSAGAAGANIGAPVILVPGTQASVDEATADLLRDLAVSEARVVGGTGVVSSGMAASIDAVVPTVRRLAGADRYGTSLAINANAFTSAPSAVMVSGLNFPDALGGSVLAGKRGSPMYISPTTCVPAAMVEHIVDLSVQQIMLLGGGGALGSSVAQLQRC